jgi:hypothetical protein
MTRDWKPVLRLTPGHLILLVRDETGDLLKARLPLSPRHPRALLTLLEGLSLWSGEALSVVVSAGESSDWAGSGLFGDELFPAESQLVQFRIGRRGCRGHRLRGVGDFRALRRGAR